jgi:hypothetical protein
VTHIPHFTASVAAASLTISHARHGAVVAPEEDLVEHWAGLWPSPRKKLRRSGRCSITWEVQGGREEEGGVRFPHFQELCEVCEVTVDEAPSRIYQCETDQTPPPPPPLTSPRVLPPDVV